MAADEEKKPEPKKNNIKNGINGGGGEPKKNEGRKEQKKELERMDAKKQSYEEPLTTIMNKQNSDGPITVILKTNVHCEGCAFRIKKAIDKIKGVETVNTDIDNDKLTVVGKVDPGMIRERVESKTRKKVELISPLNYVPRKDVVLKKPEAKNPEKPKEFGCIVKDVLEKLRELFGKSEYKSRSNFQGMYHERNARDSRFKATVHDTRPLIGVYSVDVDSSKDLVTVIGIMDVDMLHTHLKEKLKRNVEIVPRGKEGENKAKWAGVEKMGSVGGGEKKGNTVVTEKNKGGEKKGKKDGEEKTKGDVIDDEALWPMFNSDVNKMEYHGPPKYTVETVPAPQLFSDDNPNACSVM